MAETGDPSKENVCEYEEYTYVKREKLGSSEPITGAERNDSGRFAFFDPFREDAAHHDHCSTRTDDPTGPPRRSSQRDSWITILLRTLRLQVLYAHFHQKSEPSKITLQKSRPIALLRGIIHLAPLSAAITVITLNTVGIYVGSAVSWLPSLQFLAKFEEILMNASIAAIVFAYVRHELLNHGMPFGALFSALEVTTLSFLWSLEFWGSLTSPHLCGRRKLVFLASMVLSILLASSVGPSIAIALIPRQTDFPAGRTFIWMNITQNDMFPAKLTAGNIPPGCSTSSTLSLVGNQCPSSEWPTIAAMLSPLIYGQTWTGLQTVETERELWVDVTTEGTVNSVFVRTPQAAIAEVLQNVGYLWDAAVADYPYTGGNPSRFRSTNNVVHAVESIQPLVITRCLQNKVGSYPLEFPTRQPSWSTQQGHWATATYSPPSNISAMEDTYRIRWLELPTANFPNVSLGAIIQPPQTLEDPLADPRPLACSIYAGWIHTQVNLSRSSEYVQGSIPSGTNVFTWPIDWVSISSEWAASLTPPLSDENTTVDAAFYSTLNGNLDTDQENSSHPAYIHEAVLANLVTNGMARNGFSSGILGNPAADLPNSLPNPTNRQWLSNSNHNIFSTDPNDAEASYRIELVSTIFGIAYTTHGVPIKLALAVLVLYCMCAIGHLFYAASTGISSNSWETIAEVTTLALASKNSDKLHNTTSGIMTMGVFREPVRICALADGHLELVFDGDGKESDALEMGKVKPEVLKVNRMRIRARDGPGWAGFYSPSNLALLD